MLTYHTRMVKEAQCDDEESNTCIGVLQAQGVVHLDKFLGVGLGLTHSRQNETRKQLGKGGLTLRAV